MGNTYANLDAKGTAKGTDVILTYAVRRIRAQMVEASLNVSYKDLEDKALSTSTATPKPSTWVTAALLIRDVFNTLWFFCCPAQINRGQSPAYFNPFSLLRKIMGIADVEHPEHFIQAHTQPSLSWHFDSHVLQVEKRVLFEHGPSYVGHELLVANLGDFHVLDGAGQMLVRNAEGVELISNVCRHRQATLLQGRGNAQNIVCPLHRWTYQTDGKLMGAPHFPQNPCLHLNKFPLQNWNGMLFAGNRDVAKDLANVGVMRDLDFSGYMLDRVQVDEYTFNWKTFIEVYLEDYHVVPFHPGLGNFVDCDELKWEFGEHYSVQTVGIRNGLRNAGSEVYGKWQEQVLRYHGGKLPKYGAIWLTYYPNIMVEWYPGTLVISTLIPRGPEACSNIVEFYYLEDIVLFEREFVAAEQKAYNETAEEDNVICLRMHQGRKSLYQRGIDEQGPYQSPTEDGMRHFHAFLQRNLAGYL